MEIDRSAARSPNDNTYKDSFVSSYRNRAVCKVCTGPFRGTGWLIGDHILITNAHVAGNEGKCTLAKFQVEPRSSRKASRNFSVNLGGHPIVSSPRRETFLDAQGNTQRRPIDTLHLDYAIMEIGQNSSDQLADIIKNRPYKLQPWQGEAPTQGKLTAHPTDARDKVNSRGSIKPSSNPSNPLTVHHWCKNFGGSSGGVVRAKPSSGETYQPYALNYWGHADGSGSAVKINAIIDDLERKGRYEEILHWVPTWKPEGSPQALFTAANTRFDQGKKDQKFIALVLQAMRRDRDKDLGRESLDQMQRVEGAGLLVACYSLGFQLSKNEKCAADWLARYNELGGDRGELYHTIGRSLETRAPFPFPTDKKEALLWYKQAAKHHNQAAQTRIKELQTLQAKAASTSRRKASQALNNGLAIGGAAVAITGAVLTMTGVGAVVGIPLIAVGTGMNVGGAVFEGIETLS